MFETKEWVTTNLELPAGPEMMTNALKAVTEPTHEYFRYFQPVIRLMRKLMDEDNPNCPKAAAPDSVALSRRVPMP